MAPDPTRARDAHEFGMALQPESPEPLYQQVRSVMASWIKDGKLQPHDKIPSEHQLCECFSVSRMTVRQALSKLKEEGVIYTRHGKGVFVAEPPPGLELTFVLTGYSEETAPVHGALSSIVIDARLVPATAALTEALSLPQAEKLIRIKRLRSLRGSPVGIQTTHIPHRLCPGYLDRDLHTKTTLEIVQEEYHLSLANIVQVVKAELSGPQVMKYLKLSNPVPLLILERKTFLDSGEVVEICSSAYLADSFQLLLSLDMSHWPFRVEGNDQHQED